VSGLRAAPPARPPPGAAAASGVGVGGGDVGSGGAGPFGSGAGGAADAGDDNDDDDREASDPASALPSRLDALADGWGLALRERAPGALAAWAEIGLWKREGERLARERREASRQSVGGLFSAAPGAGGPGGVGGGGFAFGFGH